MKKINQLMKELGFNEKGSDAVKEAFIKNLIKASTGVDIITPSEKKIIQNNPDKFLQFPNQLSFDFITEESRKKKA